MGTCLRPTQLTRHAVLGRWSDLANLHYECHSVSEWLLANKI
jgi:hypothetical protein